VDWLAFSLVSVAIAMAMLVAAYAYVYAQQHRPEMGLWALGWMAYLGQYFSMLVGLFLPLSALWNYITLALLGLSAFLLWAGTRYFVGRPFPRHAYILGVLLPTIGAGVVFLGPDEQPWLAIPVFLFVGAVDLFTAASLYRYSRSGEGLRGAKGVALGYGLWGLLALAYPFVRLLLPSLSLLPLSLLLVNGLALALAISLIGLSMHEAERRARQQAERLESLNAIAATISTVHDLDEVLNLIVRQAAELIGAETVAIPLLSEDGAHLNYAAVYGRLAPDLAGCIRPLRDTGICNWVVRNKQGFYSDDLATDERESKEMKEALGMQTVISAPMLLKGKAIGTITAINRRDGGRFTRADLEECLQPLANQAAIAIENARLYERERQRLARRARMLELSRELRLSLDLSETLNRICQAVVEDLGWQQVIISLRDYETKTSRPVAMAGYDEETVARTLSLPPMPFEEFDILREEFRISHSYYINHRHRDAIADYPDELIVTAPAPDLEPGGWHPDDILLVPIEGREGILGFISPDNPINRQRPTLEMVQELEAFANQAAVAIENARLFGEMQQQARDLGMLYEMSRLLASSLETTRMLGQIARRCTEVFDADLTLVRLVENDRLVVRGSYFRDPAEREEVEGLLVAHPIRVGEGIAGQVATSGEPAVHRGEDVSRLTLPGYVAYLRTREWVVVPMRIGETITGVLTLIRRSEKGPFLERDVALAQGIADQVAIAIENARLFEEAQQRARQLEALTKVGRAIGSTLDLGEVLELILAQLEQVVPYDAVSLWLREGEMMRIQAVQGFEASEAHLGLTVTIPDDPLSQEMVSTRRPLILADAQQDERFRGLAGTEWVRSWLGVPLLSKGEVVGLLTIDKREPGLYTAEMAELALAFGQQAAIAIENARLFKETKRRAEEMAALYRTSLEIGVTADLPDLLWTICDRAARLLDVDKGGLYLYDEAREELELVVSYKLERDFTGTRIKLGEGVAGRVVQTGQPLIVNDYSCWDGRARVYEGEPFAAVIGVPLRWQERVIGAIILSEETERRTFTPDDERLLGLFAQQAAIAIENARLFEETRQYVSRLERKTRDMGLVHQVSRMVSSSLDLTRILETTVEQMAAVFEADHSGILLFDPAHTYGQVVAEYPSTGATMERFPVQGYLAAERIIADREPLVIEDTWQDPLMAAVREAMHRLDIRSMLIVPLTVRGEVIGSIGLDAVGRQRRFTAEEVALAQTIANQVSIAIENARLYEKTRRHMEELTALHSIDMAIASTLDLDEMLQRVYEQVSAVMDIAAFHIALYDEEKDELHLSLMVDQGERVPPRTFKVKGESGLSGWVVRTREPLWIGDMEKERDTLPVKAIALGAPTRSLMVLPLVVRDKIVGVMSAQSYEPYAFDEGHRRLFSDIASQVAIAVENARLFEETRRRLTETRLLQEVMQAAASTLDFDEVLVRTIQTLHRTLNIDYLGFAIPDESGTVLVAHPSMIGFEAPQGEPMRLPLDGSILGLVYQTGEPLLVLDVERSPYYFKAAPGIRSELAVPVRVGDEVIAVLNAESPHLGAFSEEDLRLFSAVAAQLGVVLKNARLYQALQERTNELSQAYEELKELDRLRTQLVQNVGHELRTPLSLIQGYVELLLQGDLGPILDSQRAALQIIREHTATLTRLIYNLTMLQAVPRETLALAPVSVVEVVQHALAEFRRSAGRAGIVFREELPAGLPPVLGDRERLGLVFSHLIDNAIKFSPNGGTVTIRAWADESQVYVSITDEGIGIAPEHLGRVFERFYQVDGSTTRRFGGMGIGLALALEVVEAHGGTVEVKSEPGKGSTFTVVLPQAEDSSTD